MHKTLIALLVMVALGTTAPTAAGTHTPFERSRSTLSSRLEQLTTLSTSAHVWGQHTSSVGLPETGPGSLVRTATGAVLVDIHVSNTSAATAAALETAGARITHVASGYSVITALVSPTHLQTLATLPFVEHIGESLQPQIRGAALPKQHSAQTTSAPICPSGVVSEGDVQLKAVDARAAFGVSGAGIHVGVLSDSFDDSSAATSADDDIASGDLPGEQNPCGHTTPVTVLPSAITGGTDEGRAMLQIVHDLAPGAELLFATADGGLFTFADNIRALRTAGADIIVDDIIYYGEPFFQDGPINAAISDVVDDGAVYLTAAGNSNVVDRAGHNVGSYEAAAFRPTDCPTLPNLAANSRPAKCHNFAPSGAADPTSGFMLDSGASLTIELQWAEPWFGVETDFDFYLLDNTTGAILARSLDVNAGSNGSQRPFELLSYTAANATSVSVVVGRFSGTATPRIKYVIQNTNSSLPGNGIASTEYHSENNQTDLFGPTIGDHAASAKALSIAATRYNDGSRTEGFSSNGPATHYFGAVTPIAPNENDDEPLLKQPAAALAQPLVISKPDLSATDGAATTFFNQYESTSQRYRFYGTSAAAPHAAGVAALISERARAQQITPNAPLIKRVLENTAAPMASGATANGAGLIDGVAAMRAVSDVQLRIFAPIIFQP